MRWMSAHGISATVGYLYAAIIVWRNKNLIDFFTFFALQVNKMYTFP